MRYDAAGAVFSYFSEVIYGGITINLLSVYALYVTESHDFFAYIQIDSGTNEMSNIFDHPPTLQ